MRNDLYIIRVNLSSYALQPETTPPWEPITAALTRGQKWTRAAGVDWSSGRRWVKTGEGRCAWVSEGEAAHLRW